MKIFFLFKNSFGYFYLTVSLVLTFWSITLFEIYMKISNGIVIPDVFKTIFLKLLNDFWVALLLGLLFFPIYLAIAYFKKNWSEIIIKILFSLIIIGQFSLVKYSITTLINLGADILGYSIDDMYTTVTASESFSFLYFFPFIIFPILFLVINNLLNKFTNKRHASIISGISAILFIGLKFFIPDASDSTFQNKLSFFTTDIIRFQQDKNLFNADNLFYKKEYPLVKPFNSSADVLAPFFEIKEEKPNIVMIIVEGLGSEFIGKNSYRGFTPYLDSLIPKSLYWENFVSNAGRTFGA